MNIEENNKHLLRSRLISGFFGLILLLSSGFFIFKLHSIRLLPAKFFYPLLIVLFLVNLSYFLLTLRKKAGKIIKTLLGIFAIILSAGLIFVGLKIELRDRKSVV